MTSGKKSFIKDSRGFVDNTKNEKLNESEKLASFDIKDTYRSLSTDEVLAEIKRRIKESSFLTINNKPASIKINGKFYNQKDGLFTDAPWFLCFAEKYIQRVEGREIYKIPYAPRLWYRKVDDTFAITLHDSVKTLEELNKISNNIEFSMESAEDGKRTFLDCLISVNENREKRELRSEV